MASSYYIPSTPSVPPATPLNSTIGSLGDIYLSVDPYPSTTVSRILTLTGKQSPRITSITAVGLEGTIALETNTTWVAYVRLTPGKNTLYVYGTDVSSNNTAKVEINITLTTLTQEVHQVFNNVSEHGIVRALPQIKGEKNYYYKNRLKEVFRNPSNTTLPGVHYGINRELSLKYFPAFRIRSKRQTDGTYGATNCTVTIDNCVMKIEGAQFYAKDELVYVEPASDTCDLTYYPRFTSAFRLRTLDGDLIPYTKYTVDKHEKEIKLTTTEYRGEKLRVSYYYTYVTYLYEKTLEDLMIELEAIVVDGRYLFECAVRDPQWPAAGLFQTPYPLRIQSAYRQFWWSRLRVRELHNEWFRDYILNDYDAAWGTKLEGWAKEIESKTSILWKDTQLDEHYWNVIPEHVRSFGTLPHLFDCFRGHWNCSNPTHNPRYTMKDYLRYSGTCPIHSVPLTYKGVKRDEFQSGTGTRDDLLVSLTAFS